MKKILRKKILFLIYELEQLSIGGIDVSKPIEEAFEMLQVLVNEEVYAEVLDMWKNRASAADVDSLTLGLMQFDREVRLLFIDKKLI